MLLARVRPRLFCMCDKRHDISRKHFSPYSFWSLLLYQIVSFDGNDKALRVAESMLPFEKAEKALSSTTKIEQYRLLLLFSIWSSNTQASSIKPHHWRWRWRKRLLPASSTDNWNGKRKDEQEKRTYIDIYMKYFIMFIVQQFHFNWRALRHTHTLAIHYCLVIWFSLGYEIIMIFHKIAFAGECGDMEDGIRGLVEFNRIRIRCSCSTSYVCSASVGATVSVLYCIVRVCATALDIVEVFLHMLFEWNWSWIPFRSFEAPICISIRNVCIAQTIIAFPRINELHKIQIQPAMLRRYISRCSFSFSDALAFGVNAVVAMKRKYICIFVPPACYCSWNFKLEIMSDGFMNEWIRISNVSVVNVERQTQCSSRERIETTNGSARILI